MVFSDSQQSIDATFKFLLISRSARSISLIFVTLAFSLYLHILGFGLVFIGLVYLPIVVFNMLLSLVLGILGDRIGYSRALIIGDILPVFGLAGLSLSTNIAIVAVSAVATGITGTAGGARGAFSPGLTAFIASNWPDEVSRVNMLARMSVVASLSAIVGSFLLLTHGYLTPYFGSVGTFHVLFVASFFVMLISLVSLLFLKERRRPRKTSRVMKRESFSYLLRVMLPNIMNGSAIGIALPLLPLWFELRYSISVSTVGEIFTLAYAATAAGSYLSGKYLNSARISAIRVSSVTRFFQGGILVAIALIPFLPAAFILYAARSAVAGAGIPMRGAISIRGIGDEDYGTASSLQGVATRGSQTTSGLSGYLMDASFQSPLIVGGIIQIGSSIVYYRAIRNWEKRRESSAGESQES